VTFLPSQNSKKQPKQNSKILGFQAFVQPGDEVLVVEPFFDIYKGACEMAGGTLTHIPLRPKVTNARFLPSFPSTFLTSPEKKHSTQSRHRFGPLRIWRWIWTNFAKN
jgi:hypothetical protein